MQFPNSTIELSNYCIPILYVYLIKIFNDICITESWNNLNIYIIEVYNDLLNYVSIVRFSLNLISVAIALRIRERRTYNSNSVSYILHDIIEKFFDVN